MTQIPFNVSARTARLIGRENVSNAEGALIEIVKNSYDADADICIVYFKNTFNGIPEKLSSEKYKQISQNNDFPKIKDCYELQGDMYELKLTAVDKTNLLDAFFKTFSEIYIADNGTGMTAEILKNQWMMIGTDNKLENYISKKKRIQTGAKGIGRFALDRLGSFSQVITKPEGSKGGLIWKVNWEDFEKKGTNINSIYADLEVSKDLDLKKFLFRKINIDNNDTLAKLIDKFEHGTILKITSVRDRWTNESISNIYKVLESLTPPGAFREFKMYVFDSSNLNSFGEVKNFINEDFDYKISASFNSNKKLTIKVYRREFDYKKIDKRLFEQEEMKHLPFLEEDFKKGFFVKKMPIDELMPWSIGSAFLLKQLGPFEFNFYFIKRQTTAEDKAMFFFRDFNSVQRANWIERSGGIKLFRDNFRVRPYGEPGSSAYDWLGLDARAAKSPAGFAQRIGQWRTRSQQIAGEVSISRLTNLYFDDKSSREGIQENTYFKLFRNILGEIITLFERDREYIGVAMKNLSKKINEEERTKEDASSIVNELTSTTESQTSLIDNNPNTLKEKLETVVKGYKIKEKEQEELLTEMKMLRTLASSGLLIITFAHELRQLGGTLARRVDLLKISLDDVVDKKKLAAVESFKDPYKRLQRIKEDDSKLKSWIDLSIDALQKDKRDRVKVNIVKYLSQYVDYLKNVVGFKKASINLTSESEEIGIKVFPIDLDSIFNNLIANSITAFLRKDAPEDRIININLTSKNNEVIIDYKDSGPGLDKSIPYPEKIFELFYTTKVNEVGEKVGTGLGMWIIKAIVDEYNGSIEITNYKGGFGIRIKIPQK